MPYTSTSSQLQKLLQPYLQYLHFLTSTACIHRSTHRLHTNTQYSKQPTASHSFGTNAFTLYGSVLSIHIMCTYNVPTYIVRNLPFTTHVLTGYLKCTIIMFCEERILVFPAASRPSINIRMSFLPNSFASAFPILTRTCREASQSK